MAKAVEITFAIGAALAGSFAGTFGKAGKALSDFQKQAKQLQKQSGQIESYQKMQGAIVKNAAEMYSMTDQAEALNAQAAASKARTQDLSSQYRVAQQEASRLNAENVRNTDAYKAAQLNVKSLEKQIASSSQPTAELQKQYKAAQEEVRRLEGAMKQSSAAYKAAQQNAQGLNRQMKDSKRETKSLTDRSQELTDNAGKLQQTIDRDKESLERMRKELQAAGIDTGNLANEQARLTQQSQRMAEAQARYQRSKAALDQTRQNLSWNNMKGELMTAAGLGYSLYKPVSQAADFESAMARVNAVAFSGAGRDKEADAKSFKALEEQARQLGRDTQFTAVQAAQSQENLARAGFKANEIISAMPGLLNMAAAEGMDLAQASDIAASTLRGFKLSADQMNRVADVLAQTSAASNTNIVGLGEGMKYVAPVAANLGVSLEETAAMLGVMANAGIKGTEGGTALRGAFLRLAQEPKAVEKALTRLGVASRDAKGNMRQLPDIMLELSDKMKDMGEADKTKYLADIFGVRAVSGMMAVMNGALDGSLEQLRRYNYEATGELKAISEAVGVSTEKMWEGMKGSEPFMQRLGISFRDLSIYTAMLAKSGITGADANKALTATFSQLAKNSAQVKKALKGYKISLFKDDGTMRDFPDLLNDINNAMKGMTDAQQVQALTKIFGKDAVPGIRAMMKEIEQGTFTELNQKADSAKGTSFEMMQKQLATLRGQMTLAGSAISDVMIEIGNALLPIATDIVSAFTSVTAGIGKFMQESPEITKWVVRSVAAFAAWKVGFVGLKIGWNLLKLPFQSARVAIDFLNLKLVAQGKQAGMLSKVWRGLKSGLQGVGGAFKAVGKGIWGAFKGLGKGLFDVGKLAAYKAKAVAVTVATKAWAGAQKLWGLAMKGAGKLLDVGKLALYYGKQLVIATATKAWTAAQWLWNAAMTANPIGLIIAAIAGAIAIGYLLYKNWDKLKEWWNSWTIKDVFAAIKDYAGRAWSYVVGKWNEFWDWWDTTSLSDFFAPVKDYALSAWNFAREKWEEFSAWWDSVSFSDLFAPVKEYALGAWNYVKGKWQEFGDWWDSWSLEDIFPEGFSLSWDDVISGWENAKGIIASGWENFIAVLAPGFERWKNAFLTVKDVAVSYLSHIAEHWGRVFEGVANLIASGWNKVEGLLRNVDFSGIWETLASGFATVCDTIKGAWEGVTGFIKSAWDTASEYVSGAWKWTKGLFGFDTEGEELEAQLQDITALNKMSEGFSQRVAEMTAAWQPFKDSLSEGFREIYTVMQGVSDRIHSIVIPAVNELVSALSRVASEITSIVQAGNLEVQVSAPSLGGNSTVQRTLGGRKRAEGGIITRPEIALIGEAGREAIIPLERQSRGAELWLEAGRELGLISTSNTATSQESAQSYNVISNIIPHAEGGIFSQPHIGLVAEAGREAIIPLENQARGMQLWFEAGRELGIFPDDTQESPFGIPLWKAADETQGISFGTSSNSTSTQAVFSPSITITVNGGEQDTEQRYRDMFTEIFEDLYAQFQDRMQRVAFE